MRRLLLTLSLLCMPFVAAGQTSAGDQTVNPVQPLVKKNQTWPMQGALLWRSDNTTTADMQNGSHLLSINPLGGGTVKSSTLQYGITPSVSAQAEVTQRSWVTQPRIVSGEMGATYNSGRYSLGLSVAQNQVPNPTPLPRVLPGAAPGVNGLPDFASATQWNARGRFALNADSGLVLGASMGRIRLLPGNQWGLSMLDQKMLSFGIEHGSVSTSIVGRTMQPEPGSVMPGMLNPDHRWNSIDLGVTWHLPWQGSLSFGAQNLWSSGNASNTPAGPPEPDQSRTPYVQYHQDL